MRKLLLAATIVALPGWVMAQVQPQNPICVGAPCAQNTVAAAGTANALNAQGSVSGAAVRLYASGTDANINVDVRGQGTGGVLLGANQTNSILLAGASTGNRPGISAVGSDTDIVLAIAAKGVGSITLVNNQPNYLVVDGAAAGSPVRLRPSGSDTNIPLILQPKGTGALVAQYPDNAATGGNARGANATDWQTTRSAATQVASGSAATIAGGAFNTASGNTSFAAGTSNSASGVSSVALGQQNTASNAGAAVGGGILNTASGDTSTVAGGYQNVADAQGSFVPGGRNGTVRGHYGAMAHASGGFAVTGDAQTRTMVLRANSTSTTAVRFTADGTAASASNTVNIPNNTVFQVQGAVACRDTSAPGNSYSYSFLNGILERGATASTTTWTLGNVGAANGNGTGTTLGFGIAADTTLGALNITYGAPNTNAWRCVMRVQTVEVQ